MVFENVTSVNSLEQCISWTLLCFFLRSHLISRCHLCSVLRDFLILLVVVSYQKEAFSTGWCRLFPEHPLHVNLIKDLIVTAFLVWNKFLELSSYNKQNKIVFFHKLNFFKKNIVLSNVLNGIWIKWQCCCLLKLPYRATHRKYVCAQYNYSHFCMMFRSLDASIQQDWIKPVVLD